ncbi:MAG: prephenate dehydrogenase/arogenate dehydrogenase family protein [Planctomycetota bacterium]|nr:MAG: prephenate dehydrogenase/arogenate dehydrogenase family protein [Planctomycetota bacterium]
MASLRSVTIVGVGLIGGSIGLGVRARGLAAKVVGYGSRPATLEAALKLGAVDEVAADPAAAVAEAELVVVCAPVDHIAKRVQQLAPLCQPGTLLTDAGSTKAQIVRELEAAAAGWNPDVRFVGSHPLAGNEKRGPQHASADLFAGRVVVVTPTTQTRPDDRRKLETFWSELGARVVEMPPEEHDAALAVTSHLPHLVAAALAGSTPEEFVQLTAGGWQDSTRIAAGDPSLWRQILLANRDNLLAALARFADLAAEYRQALEGSDAAQLEHLLAEAKRIRDACDARL